MVFTDLVEAWVRRRLVHGPFHLATTQIWETLISTSFERLSWVQIWVERIFTRSMRFHLLRTRLTEANNGIFCYCPLTLHIYKHFVYSPMSLKSGLCLQTSDSVSIQANEFTKKNRNCQNRKSKWIGFQRIKLNAKYWVFLRRFPVTCFLNNSPARDLLQPSPQHQRCL